MKLLVLLLLVCFAPNVLGQSSEIDNFFQKDGISFWYPKDWYISEEDYDEEMDYHSVTIEKEGTESSGIVSISWINVDFELIEWMDIYTNLLTNQPFYIESKIKLEDLNEGKYNDENCKTLKFNFELDNEKYTGVIYGFQKSNKTISILTQSSISEEEINKLGFEKIENSLTINQ